MSIEPNLSKAEVYLCRTHLNFYWTLTRIPVPKSPRPRVTTWYIKGGFVLILKLNHLLYCRNTSFFCMLFWFIINIRKIIYKCKIKLYVCIFRNISEILVWKTRLSLIFHLTVVVLFSYGSVTLSLLSSSGRINS